MKISGPSSIAGGPQKKKEKKNGLASLTEILIFEVSGVFIIRVKH